MTTITLKINEKTNFGKTFLAFLKTLTDKEKTVEIIKEPNIGLEESINDYKAGRIIKAKNAEDLIKKLKS